MEDPPLAPSVDATSLSSSNLRATPSPASSQVDVPSHVSSATSSTAVFSLALGVSRFGCGFVDSQSQKAAHLVEVGRTIVKGNKVIPSTSILLRMDLFVAPSQVVDVRVAISSLVSGIFGIGSGVADL